MSDKISTQNMGTTGSNLNFSSPAKTEHTPMPVVKRNVFTDLEREELREIFHSVLEEYSLGKVEERLQKLEEQAHRKPTGATQKRNDDRLEDLENSVKKLIDK